MIVPRLFHHGLNMDGNADDGAIHLIQGGVAVSKVEFFLSQEGNLVINKRIQRIIMGAGQNKPAPSRKRHALSYVVIPIDA